MKMIQTVRVGSARYNIVYIDGVPTPQEIELAKKHDFVVCLFPEEHCPEDAGGKYDTREDYQYDRNRLYELLYIMCDKTILDIPPELQGNLQIDDLKHCKVQEVKGTHEIDLNKIKCLFLSGLWDDKKKQFNFESAVNHLHLDKTNIADRVYRWLAESVNTEQKELDNFKVNDITSVVFSAVK